MIKLTLMLIHFPHLHVLLLSHQKIKYWSNSTKYSFNFFLSAKKSRKPWLSLVQYFLKHGPKIHCFCRFLLVNIKSKTTFLKSQHFTDLHSQKVYLLFCTFARCGSVEWDDTRGSAEWIWGLHSIKSLSSHCVCKTKERWCHESTIQGMCFFCVFLNDMALCILLEGQHND